MALENAERDCWVDFLQRVEEMFHYCYNYLPLKLQTLALSELDHRLKKLLIELNLAYTEQQQNQTGVPACGEQSNVSPVQQDVLPSLEGSIDADKILVEVGYISYPSTAKQPDCELRKPLYQREELLDKKDKCTQTYSLPVYDPLAGQTENPHYHGYQDTWLTDRECKQETVSKQSLKEESDSPNFPIISKDEDVAEDKAPDSKPSKKDFSTTLRRSKGQAPKYTDSDEEVKEELDSDHELSCKYVSSQVKRPRGRPRKYTATTGDSDVILDKPRRGRQKKNLEKTDAAANINAKRGRPRKPRENRSSIQAKTDIFPDESSMHGHPPKRGPGRPRSEITVVTTEESNLEGEFNIDDIHCKICNRMFIHVDLYKKHMKEHETRPRYKCEQCGKDFLQPSTLEKHMKTHILNMLKCTCCYFVTKDAAILESHVKDKHTTHKNMICDECGKSFRRPSELKRHILLVHKAGEVKLRYTCKECDFTTSKTNSLKQHIKNIHETTDLFYCHICGKGMKRRHDLQGHLASHRGEKKFSCKICNKHFATESQVRSHKPVHMPPSYECNICGKKFQRQFHLNRHKIIHSGAKPFSCPFDCKYECKFKSNLRKHCRAVHDMVYPPIIQTKLEKIGTMETIEEIQVGNSDEVKLDVKTKADDQTRHDWTIKQIWDKVTR